MSAAQPQIKTEYHGLIEIAERLQKSRDVVRRLIKEPHDPLPVKKVGDEYWLTEVKLQEWLNQV
jgi:hypothetical protein